MSVLQVPRVKRSSRKRLVVAAVAAVTAGLYPSSPAHAATYTFDLIQSGYGSDYAGTWDTTSYLWSDGAGNDVQWPNDGTNIANFGTSTGNGGAGLAVMVAEPLSALGISFTGPGDGWTLGTVSASSLLTLGSAGISVSSGSLADSINVPLILAADQTWDNESANTLTIAGVTSGTGAITKTGAGTIALTGTSTDTGTLSVLAGTLNLVASGTSSTSSYTFGAISVGPNGTLGLVGNNVFSYAVSPVRPTLIIAGGTVTSASNYIGQTTFIGGGLINGAGGVKLQSTPNGGNGSNFVLAVTQGTGTNTTAVISAPLSLYSNTIFNVSSVVSSGYDLSISGIISAGLSSAGITKNGVGTLILTTNNTFTGATTINGGTLYANGGNSAYSALGTTAGVVINSGGTLYAGSDNGLFGQSATVPVTINSGGLLTESTTNSNHTKGLIVLNGGTLGTSGTNTSSYGSFGLDGGLTVTANSVLSATNLVGVQTGGTQIGVAAGVTLISSGTFTHPANTSDSGYIFTGPGTVVASGSIVSTKGVTVNAGTLYVAAASGNILGSATGLSINNGGTVYIAGADNGFVGQSSTLPITINTGGLLTTTTTNSNHTAGLIALNGGTLSTVGTNTNSYGSYNLDGGLTVTANSVISASNIHGTQVGGEQIGIAAGTTLTASGVFNTGSFGTATGILLTGPGTAIFTGANTYSNATQVAGTTIAAGILQIGNGGTTGSLPTTGALVDNATLVVNRSNAVTQGTDFSTISGTGNVIDNGAGTLTLNKINTFTGNITVNSGTLAAGTTQGTTVGSELGSTSFAGRVVQINSGATLAFTINNTLNNGTYIPTLFANGGTITTNNFNQLANVNLNAATFTYTQVGSTGYGGYSIIAGSTITAGGSAASSITGTAPGAAGINLSGAITFAVADATGDANSDLNVTTPLINGNGITGSLTQIGAGTMALSAVNTYTGGTTILGGVFQLGAGSTTGSLSTTGAISIGSGAFLAFNRSNAVAQGTDFSAAALTGAGGLIQNGSSTVTLGTNTNSFGGNISINGGTLVASVAAASTTLTSALGAFGANTNGRTISVNTGGTLQFATSNIFGPAAAATIRPDIILNGGTLTASAFNGLGNLVLNGGKVTGTATGGTSYGLYQLSQSVTVGGAAASTMGLAGEYINLGAPTTFNVSSTGAGTDLTVNATLQNRSPDGPSAVSGLIKAGAGTLLLASADTYTGGTSVTQGVLAVAANGGLSTGNVSVSSGATLSDGTGASNTTNDFISDTATLALSSGATVSLNYTGGIDVVKALIIDGTSYAAGTYGSATSGATNILGEFTGSGELSVGAVPEPASLSLIGLSAVGLLSRRKRKRDVSSC